MTAGPPGFQYPEGPHVRRHGPGGYQDYESYRDWLRDEFTFRCVYCLNREQWGVPIAAFDIDHFIPQANDSSLGCVYDNLLYLCHGCNLKKGSNQLPDPCKVALHKSIRVFNDGRITGLDPFGKKIIKLLALEDPNWVRWRAMLIDLFNDLLNNPTRLKLWLGYPERLPELAKKRPISNSRPQGIEQSYFCRHFKGLLPEVY